MQAQRKEQHTQSSGQTLKTFHGYLSFTHAPNHSSEEDC